MFGVLAADLVSRRATAPGEKFSLGDGLQAELFMVPGKLPLYLEGENPDTGKRARPMSESRFPMGNLGLPMCRARPP
jgi:hypothetical protein